MDQNPNVINIRAKKLGVLIRDARISTRREVSECAARLGMTQDEYEAIEFGETAPSLPQLECLAYLFNVPLEHFWEEQLLSATVRRKANLDLPQIIGLRQRVIGARLRMVRLEENLSLEELAHRTSSLSVEQLETYELGEALLPLPVLEELAGILKRPIKEFLDRRGPLGVWANQQRAVQGFLSLSPELQNFVGIPTNQPYLEIAHRLSELPIDRLRMVAEGLLEITF